MEMEKDIDKDIRFNIEKIKKRFQNTSDLKFREIKLGYVNTTLIIVYIDGIIDTNMLEDSVIHRITDAFNNEKAVKGKNLIESLTEKVFDYSECYNIKIFR